MHALVRSPLTRTMALLLVLIALTACAPGIDLKKSLAETVERFYGDLVAGKDPYAEWTGVEPFASLLPVTAPQVAQATLISVIAPTSGGQSGTWLAHFRIVAGSPGPAMTYTEVTEWRYRDRRWELLSAGGRDVKVQDWSQLPAVGAGLVAFSHSGRVWLLATADGSLTPVAGPEPMLHLGWSPDGRGLLMHTETELYWYRPGDDNPLLLGPVGNTGGVDWSPDGSYAAIDSGTDVVREVHIFDSETGRIVGSVTAYSFIWANEPATFVFSAPVAVTPQLPAGDGSSSSLAVGTVGSEGSGIETMVLVPGTSSVTYHPQGYGRDGELYYTGSNVYPEGAGATAWWRWDREAGLGVRLAAGARPEIAPLPGQPTIVRPAELAGPTGPGGTVAVSIAPGGRWGLFTGQDAGGVQGVYLIDLPSPHSYYRLVAGHGPAWRPAEPQ